MSGWQNRVGKTDQMFLEIMFARRLRGYDEFAASVRPGSCRGFSGPLRLPSLAAANFTPAIQASGQAPLYKKDSEGMASNYATEKGRLEAKMKEMDQEAKRERQLATAQLADLSHRLQDATDAAAADRARSESVV